MTDLGQRARTVERKLRNVECCDMKPEYEGDASRANFGLALEAARLIKRQRLEIEELLAELAYHGVYPREIECD